MTGRLPIRESNNMYAGTSANRNYQSTGRAVSHGDGNLELYVNRKNINKNNTNKEEGNIKRRGWVGNEAKNAKELALMQRYNSIDIKKRNPLENSLPPKEKNKRGLSILNREKNNFVRDVSERVKREPLAKLKSIGIYEDKKIENNEYEFTEEQKINQQEVKVNESKPKSETSKGKEKEKKKQVDNNTQKSTRLVKKSKNL